MQMLATLRSDFEGAIAEDAQLQQLHADLLERNDDEASVALLSSVLDQLRPFDIYVVAKVVEYTHRRHQVLDSRYYADDPEIRAFLRGMGLSMLRMWPRRSWQPGQPIGLFTDVAGASMEMASAEDARDLVTAGQQVDLCMVHHQDANFQHYDCLSFTPEARQLSPDKCNLVCQGLMSSPLAAAVLAQEVAAATRAALLALGIAIPVGDLDADSGPDGAGSEASHSSSETFLEGSESEQDDDTASVSASDADTHGPTAPDPFEGQPCGMDLEADVGIAEASASASAAAGGGLAAATSPDAEINDAASDALSDVSDNSDLFSTAVDATPSAVPLPGALPLAAAGLGAFGLLARRRRA